MHVPALASRLRSKNVPGAAWKIAAIAAILAGTFAIDLSTTRGVAAGVFPYFIAVFATVRLPWQVAPYIVATCAAFLALLGFYATGGGRPEIVLVNRIFIIAALYIVAFLAARWIESTRIMIAYEASRESDARYRDLFDRARLGLQIADRDGNCLMVNRALVDLLGYDSAAALVAADPLGVVALDDRENALTQITGDAADGATPKSYEVDLLRRDGSTIRAQVFWRLMDWKGQTTIQRTFVDVTERHRAQERLAENEERLRLLLDAIGDGLFGLDRNGVCTFCNPAGVRLLGYADPSDIVGRNMHALIHSRHADGSPYPESGCPVHRAFLEDREVEGGDETFWRADGTPVPVAFRSLPVRKNGTAVGAVVTFCDLTQPRADAEIRKAQDDTIRALQRELAQAARVSAIGELSSVIAHELSQPLTAIRSTADAARRQMAGTAEDRLDTLAEMLPFLSEQAERAGNVVDGIRRMFERDAPARNTEELRDIVEEACLIARREFAPDGVTIDWRPAADPARVVVDRIQIQQVMYNLIKNAAEAMTGMAEKTVSVRMAQTGPRTIEVAVSDNGPGIAPTAAARLFEPFVTTKDYGMGIGLHTCRTIVVAHGGEIGVDPAADPADGTGATIRFTMPLAK